MDFTPHCTMVTLLASRLTLKIIQKFQWLPNGHIETTLNPEVKIWLLSAVVSRVHCLKVVKWILKGAQKISAKFVHNWEHSSWFSVLKLLAELAIFCFEATRRASYCPHSLKAVKWTQKGAQKIWVQFMQIFGQPFWSIWQLLGCVDHS